jgi:hypothetical protein
MRKNSHTKENFIEKASKLHNNKYDYSLVDYKGHKNKVIIVCKIHGPFEQRAGHHLQGQNCKYCGYISASNKLRKFLSESEISFIKENYIKNGADFCAKHLKTTKDCIYHAVQKLKIKKNNSKLNHPHISGRIWSNLITRSKNRNHILDITPDDIYEKYIKQNKKCALTGLDIILSLDEKINTISVDRIDSKIGYLKDNIQIVHKLVNQCKMDLSDEIFYFLCKNVYFNLKNTFEKEA